MSAIGSTHYTMRWTRETHTEREKRLTAWHKWFAWRPVRLRISSRRESEVQRSNWPTDTRTIIWLTYTMRKLTSRGYLYMDNEEAIKDMLTYSKQAEYEPPTFTKED